MTDNNDALVQAIQALTAEVGELRATIAGLNLQAVEGAPAAAPVAAAPPVPAAAKQAAAIAAVAPLADVIPLEKTASQRLFEEAEAVIVGLFLASGDDDTEAGFEAFLQLMHTDRTDAPRSIPSLKEFNWKALRKNRDRYLQDPADSTSFTIGRRVPDELTGDDRNVKVFLECPQRSPVPVALRRDKRQDDAWRVTDSSL